MSVHPSVRPSNSRSFHPSIHQHLVIFERRIWPFFEGKNSSNDIRVNSTMSDDEVVASDEPRGTCFHPFPLRHSVSALFHLSPYFPTGSFSEGLLLKVFFPSFLTSYFFQLRHLFRVLFLYHLLPTVLFETWFQHGFSHLTFSHF